MTRRWMMAACLALGWLAPVSAEEAGSRPPRGSGSRCSTARPSAGGRSSRSPAGRPSGRSRTGARPYRSAAAKEQVRIAGARVGRGPAQRDESSDTLWANPVLLVLAGLALVLVALLAAGAPWGGRDPIHRMVSTGFAYLLLGSVSSAVMFMAVRLSAT